MRLELESALDCCSGEVLTSASSWPGAPRQLWSVSAWVLTEDLPDLGCPAPPYMLPA